jgi:hypothetical protein
MKRLSKISNEEELAAVVADYYSDFERYAEVPKRDGTIADLVFVKEGVKISVETKMNFTFNLLEQALNNRSYFDYSYIICPAGKNRRFQKKLCADYGVGLIEVAWDIKGDNKYQLFETVSPKHNENLFEVKFEEWMNKSTAGTKGNRWTVFKETVYKISSSLSRRDGQSLIELLEAHNHHYSNNTGAKKMIEGYCREGVIKDFSYENGKVWLTDYGRNQLENMYRGWELAKNK